MSWRRRRVVLIKVAVFFALINIRSWYFCGFASFCWPGWQVIAASISWLVIVFCRVVGLLSISLKPGFAGELVHYLMEKFKRLNFNIQWLICVLSVMMKMSSCQAPVYDHPRTSLWSARWGSHWILAGIFNCWRVSFCCYRAGGDQFNRDRALTLPGHCRHALSGLVC